MIKKTKLMSFLLGISMLVMFPIAAHAEWRQTNSGDWWYADQGGWAIDWQRIDNKFYYFYPETGIMAHDTNIDGFDLPSDGGWVVPKIKGSGIVSFPPLSATSFNFHFETGVIGGYYRNKEEVLIPPVIEGCKVIKIGNSAFFGNTHIKKIVVSDGIQDIGKSAFSRCDNLEEVYLPDSIQSIEWNAFTSVNTKFHVKSNRVKELLKNIHYSDSDIIVEK